METQQVSLTPKAFFLYTAGVAILAGLLVVGGILAYKSFSDETAATTKQGRFTKANFLKIQNGMTHDQVKALLGEPKGIKNLGKALDPGSYTTWHWDSGGGVWAEVYLDNNGVVFGKLRKDW